MVEGKMRSKITREQFQAFNAYIYIIHMHQTLHTTFLNHTQWHP